MRSERATDVPAHAGAYGVNYALRPHKFVDRRIFVEALSRFARVVPLNDYVYVGLGSFAMEDHKLINATFGIDKLISLEVNGDVVERQKFNSPLACIIPTDISADDFIVNKEHVLRRSGAATDSKLIAWFDMTDYVSLRVHLDTFRALLMKANIGDIVRYTVDVDAKTLGEKVADESFAEKHHRLHGRLKELLGRQFDPLVKPRSLQKPLGIAKLVLKAFSLVAEEALSRQPFILVPLSLTTYADGHRMLSVTGAVVQRTLADHFISQVHSPRFPGGTTSWDELVNIQIPQLTVWERLFLDREIGKKTTGRIAKELNFRFHESVSTTDLLKGYAEFQRFYPTFRHVLL